MTKKKSRTKEKLMYAINIKSRKIQRPDEYVLFFSKLFELNPHIAIGRDYYMALKSLIISDIMDERGVPLLIYGTFTKYENIRSDEFYNIQKKESINIAFEPYIKYKAKFIDFYFVPNCHTLVVPVNNDINYKHVVTYLQTGFNMALGSEDLVDVDVITDEATIGRIRSAYQVISIKASISYGNKNYTQGFRKVFEQKTQESNAKRLNLQLDAEKDCSLNTEADGLVDSVLGMSEKDGVVVAKIKETEDSNPETINSNNSPKKISISFNLDNFVTTIFEKVYETFRGDSRKNEKDKS